jgi:septal ring factor EnvC (AmiA/AmiB activator)
MLCLAPQQGHAADELGEVEVRWLQAEAELHQATARLRELDGRIKEIDGRLQDRDLRLAERRDRLAARLGVMYRMRRRGLLPYLFSAESAHELLETMRGFAWILRGDDAEIRAWEAERAELDGMRAQAQADREEVLRLAGEAAARREEGDQLRSRRRALVEELPPERRRVAAARWDNALEARLDGGMAEGLDGRASAASAPPVEDSPSFAGLKGRLSMPASGDLVRAARGVAILAKRGSPIRAVAGGTVARVIWIQGYGLVLILNHGGGWATVYGHAEAFSVQEGDVVERGDTLGTVGESGSIEGTRLHFEVRKDQVAQDPVGWLSVPPGVEVRR